MTGMSKLGYTLIGFALFTSAFMFWAVAGESGARRAAFRDEAERVSGLIPNSIPG